jgi:hypothetical protein
MRGNIVGGRHHVKIRIALWTTAMILTPVSLPAAAQAEVLLSGHATGQCLDMKDGTEAIVWSCHGAGNQDFRFRSGAYGELLVGGKCLASNGGAGTGLVATNCTGSRAQKWVVTNSALRNEEGWCADIERGGGQGSRVIAWHCSGSSNQRWSPGRKMSAQQALSSGRISAAQAQAAGRAALGSVIAAGGGNVVAAGGLNVIAPGGGNVVAAGGGNIYVPISSAVAAGGLN